MQGGLERFTWLLVAFGLAVPASAAAQPESTAALLERAAGLVYDLEHDEALKLARSAVALAPENPQTHRTLASIVLLKILFQRGAVTVDHYLGSFSRAKVDLDKPPPELDAEFRRHAARAIELAEGRVIASPQDAQARYDLGAGVGLQASYTATVEGRLIAGFRTARRAYHEHEKALSLDSSNKDAGLIVGMYRYVVSTLSLPMRLMAYVAGFGGGRERGIRMLEDTAAAGREARIDAMFALVLVYNRERQYDEALRILDSLRHLHPANRLVLLEAGSTSLRAGRAAQADALLTRGIGMLPAAARRMPGEEALWLYKRGAARVALGRQDTASIDLRRAASDEAPPWVHGRARVEIARIALQRGDRTAAASEARRAQELCTQGNDPVCLTETRKLLRSSNGH